MKTFIFRLLAIAIPVVFLVTAGEVLLRFRAAKLNDQAHAAWAKTYRKAPPLQHGIATMGDILRRSENPRIIYELRPNMSVEFMDATVTTDPDGYRGPAFSEPKGNTFRIVALGDSSLFG
jgi:hypothetical protein